MIVVVGVAVLAVLAVVYGLVIVCACCEDRKVAALVYRRIKIGLNICCAIFCFCSLIPVFVCVQMLTAFAFFFFPLCIAARRRRSLSLALFFLVYAVECSCRAFKCAKGEKKTRARRRPLNRR